MSKTTGIILSGGESSRMGKDKGMMVVAGKTLLDHAIDAIAPFCDHLLISANEPSYANSGYPVIPDLIPGKGPLGGIYSGLIASDTKSNLVLAVDILGFPEEIPRLLLNHAKGQMAVVPSHPDGKLEPLLAWYSKDTISKIKECLHSGKLKMYEFLNEISAFHLALMDHLEVYHPGIIPNLNRPDDLAVFTK